MPDPGHRMRLLDHRIPSLYAGAYQITAEETIDSLTTLPTRHQGFEVRGTRFALGASEIHACYPLPGAEGKYSQILPHVTLAAPALPWARLLEIDGKDTEGIPWLAVLLLREGELPDDPGAVGLVTVSTAGQLLDRQAGAGQPPQVDRGTLLDGEAETACRSILVPGDVFARIRPALSELALLAHIREGGPPDASHVRGADPEPDPKDLSSVVVASRFPSQLGGRHVAHLVSLEGHEPYLGDTAPPVGGLRLVSLHTWTFETLPDPGIGFGDLAHNLATAPDLLLRLPLPPGDADGDALERLRSGAIAVPQRLESGERSLAFYRGPLTAAPAQALPAPAEARLESAGEALAYLERWGVYDAGYASAFSLGRALAMADAPFRSDLLEFRREARRAVRRLAAHPELAAAGRSAREDGRALRGNLARQAFDELLDGPLARALARGGGQLAAAPRRPAATGSSLPGLLGTRALLASAHARAVLRAATEDQLQPVQEWLDRLAVLDMIPFDHLVPDPRMLPPESARFCYVDEGWVRAAVDGALSVGVGHAQDADLNELAAAIPDPPRSGVLIRSQLIPGWPDTIITAFSGEDTVEPVHRALYGSDVLMLLYPAVIDVFTLAEPPQGLHFGIGDLGTIELRHITGTIGYPKGQFPDPPGFAPFLRAGGGDVLDLEGRLMPALDAAHGQQLSPAQLALQMLKRPQLQTFARP
jgi:hypothetical protein